MVPVQPTQPTTPPVAGKDGKDGANGPQGPAGPAGKDADVSPLINIVNELKQQNIQLQQRLDEIANKPQPAPGLTTLPVRIIRPNGEYQDLKVPLDGKNRLDLRLSPAK